jgi:hypothetical protein
MKMELKIESTFENYPTLEKTLGKVILGGKPYNCHIKFGQWFFHNTTSWMFIDSETIDRVVIVYAKVLSIYQQNKRSLVFVVLAHSIY